MGSISMRMYIKWEGEEASEPTSTIVLTSPGRRYVDARILTDGADDGAVLPLSRLDWAIAGFSSSRPVQTPEGQTVYHAQWVHWIDSRDPNCDGASDSGINYPQPDDLTLEKGRMVNPVTGKEANYEEMWHDPRPTRGVNNSDRMVSLVLVWEGADGQRGMVVRVGGWCQGLVRDGEGISVERWRWTGGWEMQRRISSGREMEGRVPCQEVTEGRWAVGDEVVVGDATWKVVEYMEE